jgi:hypothetical protein
MTKKIIKVFILILFLGLQYCSPKNNTYTSEVNFLYKEAQGTIAVKSIGYGQDQQKAISDAQRNAFKVILFQGLPGTELNVPLIENKNEATSKNSEYLKNFFENDYYKNFMMSSTESSNLIRTKGNKKISVDIKINYNSLRKDLEQNQLIRKFGY